MAIISRATIRAEVAAGLATALTTAKTVAAYQKTQWLASDTPLVRVMSAGSGRPQLTEQGLRSTFRLAVDFWVLLSLSGGSWTAEDAENAIDRLELDLITWMAANQLGHSWTALTYDGISYVEPVKVDRGEVYLVERVLLTVEVFG